MTTALVILALLTWIALIILGLTLKGLVWLAVIGMILFLITALGAALHRAPE